MQAGAVNQLITDQLTKFIFYGDNRLQFISGFPEIAAHFELPELNYGEPPLARPDIEEEGVTPRRQLKEPLSFTFNLVCLWDIGLLLLPLRG